MPVFPSVEWFDTIKNIVNQDPEFRALGTVDSVIGVKVGAKIFQLTFEAFECTGVREAGENDLRDMDFWLEQSYDQWKAMLDNIKEHGRAEHDYTLNSLDLQSEKEFAVGKDYHRRDAFYRFNQTFQEYFDITAKIETSFAR